MKPYEPVPLPLPFTRVVNVPGELTVFDVQSETEGKPPYRVDLTAYGGNGWCNCEHFRFRLEPILARGIQKGILR